MKIFGFRHASVLGAFSVLTTALLSGSASAQQITYYDFDTPQATANQMSRQCPTSAATTGTLFCFNDGTGQNASPSFFNDIYPPVIDPVTTDNPAQQSNHFAVQMTPASISQASSMWFSVPQKVSNGFTAYFAFKMTPDPKSPATADGIAFVIQNSAGGGTDATGCAATGAGLNIVGGSGGCIGYGGIDNSLAVELDTYRNTWDPSNNGESFNDNHIAIMNCGAGLPNSPDHNGPCQVQLNVNGANVPAIIDPAGITLADGNVHQVVIQYNGPNETNPNLLQVFIDPPFVPGTHTPASTAIPVLSGVYDISKNVNLLNSGTANDSAYVGFTSATGDDDEQQEVMAWTYTPHTPVTEEQPISQPGSPTVFPFGSHVYAVTYPSTDSAPPTGVDVVITATPISPDLFSTLVSGGPFAGSQCQVYDDTGGKCVVYSTSCVNTATNDVVPCPTTTPNAPITVKTAFDNTIQPISPGFLQGDPFYTPVATISGDGTTATVTCAGDCSVTQGQTITVLGSSNQGFNSTVTVLSASTSDISTFTFASSVQGSGTGGYLNSNNLQNIFVSYSPQRIDGSIAGRTLNFGSDFVATSVTNVSTNLAISAPAITVGSPATVTVTATSGGGVPTGSISLSLDGGTAKTQTLSSTGVATFTFSGVSAGPHNLTATYTPTGEFQAATATGSLTGLSNQLLSTTSLNFGNFYPGGGGETAANVPQQGIYLTNTTSSAISFYGVSILDVGNGDSSEFAASSNCPAMLKPGAYCTITVTFSPATVYKNAGQTATLQVSDSVQGSPQSVSLLATIVQPIAQFSVTQGTVVFPSEVVGNSSNPVQFQLSNVGRNALVMKSIGLGGMSPNQFTESNNCPTTLLVGANCTITVTFSPQGVGQWGATVNFVDNEQGNLQQVSLSGTGTGD